MKWVWVVVFVLERAMEQIVNTVVNVPMASTAAVVLALKPVDW